MSVTSFKQPSPEILINELCELLGQKSFPLGQKFTSYALQTLSRLGDHPLPNSDENSIIDRMKRDLASKGKIQEAAKLSELCRKLSASGCIKNLWSILYLLRSVSRNTRSGTHAGNALLFRQGLAAASTPIIEMTPSMSHLQSTGLSSSGFGTVKTDVSGTSLPSKVGTPDSAFQNLTLGSRLAWGLTPSRTADSLVKSEKRFDSTMVSQNSTRNDRGKTVTATSTKELLEESKVIRELIDVFQGMETKHFKFSMRENAYRLVPTTDVDKRILHRAHKLCELGWLHDRIRKYINKHSKDLAFGLVGQAFCAALQQELGEYYRLLSVFQSQVYQEDQGLGGVGEYGVTLSKLVDWTCEPMDRLKWVATLVDNCKDRKGGALASTIHSFMQTGDVNMRLLTKRFLTIVSQPIFYILSRWLYEGELQDTFHEFFVAMDPSVSNERLWHEKYHIRQSMVPSFITDGQARKILLVGKSLNFLRLVCRDRTEVLISKQDFDLPEDVFANSTLDFCSELQEQVNEAYEATSRCLLKVLFDRYKLLLHLQALRKFLLLGQGDFVRHLLDLLHDDLAKPASQLYRHNLNGLVESAVRATNAQFEDPDVQSRLDLRLLEINPGDTGWDVFSLDYHINQPLNTIISPEIMLLYLRCFNFLWRAKRMEHNLATIWTDTMDHSRRLSPDLPELRGVLHACHVLAAEMVHFVHQIQYYIAFEVTRCLLAFR